MPGSKDDSNQPPSWVFVFGVFSSFEVPRNALAATHPRTITTSRFGMARSTRRHRGPKQALISSFAGSRTCSRPLIGVLGGMHWMTLVMRSEERTSELQSLRHLVCRLLLVK